MTTTSPHHDTPSSVTGGLRLTRRGRAVVLLGLVTLLVLAFVLGRTGDSQAATDTSRPVPYASTTVHSGETLWSVAKRVAPGHDPRALVAELRTLNHLTDASVQVGQQLLIPHLA